MELAAGVSWEVPGTDLSRLVVPSGSIRPAITPGGPWCTLVATEWAAFTTVSSHTSGGSVTSA